MSQEQDKKPQRVLYIVKGADLPIGPTDAVYLLLSDEGEVLAQHICSSPSWARGDLHDRRPERQAKWRERFGEYVVRWIGDDDLTEEELIRRNIAFDAAQQYD